MVEKVIITRRRTSRLSLRIGKNGEIRVSAPWQIPHSQIVEFVEGHKEWIAKAKERQERSREKRDAFYDRLPLGTKQEQLEASSRLSVIITPMYEKYAKMMGVEKMQIVFSATKSKWGSCYPACGRLQFSLYLLLFPDWCIESVVVHELCHVFVQNHGPQFYALMQRYFPRWRQAKALLASKGDTSS